MNEVSSIRTHLTNTRQERIHVSLRRQDLCPDPFEQFELWLEQALSANSTEPQAMTLATATEDGIPSARTVLLRGLDERGLVFYTNYNSQKGRELAHNPRAALLLYWPELGRQVRISGLIRRVSEAESDSYFQSRPIPSQLSAWASAQSEVIDNREILETDFKKFETQFAGQTIPRPPFWGGFRLCAHMFEFWQGQPNRLHDRFRYTLQAEGQWLIERLSS